MSKTAIRKEQGGIPTGGATNDALEKQSNADYDVAFAAITPGGGSGGTKLYLDPTQIAISNSAVETSLGSFLIPGGTLGTNNAVRFSIFVSDAKFENTGGFLLTLRLKYGGTTVYQLDIPATGGADITNVGGYIHGHLYADGATNVQKGTLQVNLVSNNSETISETSVGISKILGYKFGTAAEISTGALLLEVTAQFSSGTVGNELTTEEFLIEQISSSGVVSSGYMQGLDTRMSDAASGVQTIAHGLGSTPSRVRIAATCAYSNGANIGTMSSQGVYDGTTSSCVYLQNYVSNDIPGDGQSNDIIVITNTNAGGTQTATITVDATDITLTWTKTGTGFNANPKSINMLWEVFG